MSSFHELADEISRLEARISDAVFDVVRAQLRGEDSERTKDRERQLARARRSLQKAEQILRHVDD